MPGFTEGVARIPFVGRCAHVWRHAEDIPDPHLGQVRILQALCGIEGATYDRVPALAPGNWPLCKRCEKAQKRMTSRGLNPTNGK